MLDSYEECHDPPRLYRFDTGGNGSCLKRYSDPTYFKRSRSASESEKAEKIPGEKKHLRHKTRGSRSRNVEVQHSIPISRHSSRSTRFASPSNDDLDLTNDHISIPEHESGTASSGSKTRFSFVEQSMDTDPSVAPQEAEHDSLSISKSQINSSDSYSSTPNVNRTATTADDDSQPDSLQGSIHRSPSVTWDEKTEIVKSSRDILFDNILVDRDLDLEVLPETSETCTTDLETAEFRASEQDNILIDIPNRRPSMSSRNHTDEVTSETDNYVDAPNTLESETETDSEYQTKREVKSLPNFGLQSTELEIGNMHGAADISSDSSDVDTPMASHIPLSKDVPLESPESSNRIQSPLHTVVLPDPDISVENNDYDNVPSMSRMNIYEGGKDNPSVDSDMPSLQAVFVDENIGNGYKSIDSPSHSSITPSTKLWTNGGLLGLEPSKPPDFSGRNPSSGTVCDSSSDMMTTKLHYGESSGRLEAGVMHNENMSRNSCSLENVERPPNSSNFLDSSLNNDQLFGINNSVKDARSVHWHDNIVGQDSIESADAISCSQTEKTRDTCGSLYAHTTRHDQADTNYIESQLLESDQNTNGFSSSFSELAQRFLANSLQRKATYTPVDTSIRSAVNTDASSHETSFHNKHGEGETEDVSQISYKQNIKEKNGQQSFRKSGSPGSCYSEISSPPLEHMKISFHPMNGPETTKLKLEFPNVNLHETAEDLMFPSFQLVPGPTLPAPDTGSESDEDTFCRSSAYSSEDIHSPRSYSNSELWEQDERSGSKDNEIYDDLRRVSSSTASSSGFMEFEHINLSHLDAASEYQNCEVTDQSISLHPLQIVDVHGLDSVTSLKDEHEGQCNSHAVDHTSFSLPLPVELPPPPPLPPMQWRLLKPSFASGEDKVFSTLAPAEQFNCLQAQRFTVAQQPEQIVPRPPLSTEKLNAKREPGYAVNGNKVDEREDLLYQIRNKAFNLRRIVPAKPAATQQPATNVNVVAILEKANAIRQACVGSDEGGDDDDNWSIS